MMNNAAFQSVLIYRVPEHNNTCMSQFAKFWSHFLMTFMIWHKSYMLLNTNVTHNLDHHLSTSLFPTIKDKLNKF